MRTPRSEPAVSTKRKTKATRKGLVKSCGVLSPELRNEFKRHVYCWGDGDADGDGSMRALLGGKGANLAEMTRIGLPVPPGFTLTTEVCSHFYANDKTYPDGLDLQMRDGIRRMEKIMGCKFGDPDAMPLLVSVRSGARDSMPGMMDTILNLGLNGQSVESLAKATANEPFAWDCYRRFVQMYGEVVLGVGKSEVDQENPFDKIYTEVSESTSSEMSVADLRDVVARFRALILDVTGRDFPDDPWKQLMGAVGAVFGSWMNDRAVIYRSKYGIPSSWGTGVSVQAMVYGNTGDSSGSGVAFTRNPATGKNEFYGEFLVNAQGEDVVAGIRTPQPISDLRKRMPKAYAELRRVRSTLESHFKDMQDIEFTIQDGRVFMLQTRNGKRTAEAALRIAVEMCREELIDWKKALCMVPPEQLDQLLAPVFDREALAGHAPITKGLPAGPGAACGNLYLDADTAVAAAERGESVVLVRMETSPEDLRGMIAACGTLTARGGVSSHAALVARQMGKVCVCGAGDLEIDASRKSVRIGKVTLHEGDPLSIDGTTGNVYVGKIGTVPSEIISAILHRDAEARRTSKYRHFQCLMKWCDDATRLQIRTNADTPEQTRVALAFGATGIGLVRTEHMFFEGDRIDAVREMILAESDSARKAPLEKLLSYQREDFLAIFKELKGRPVTIRLLDPPLHEFLPRDSESQADLAAKLGISKKHVAARVRALEETNPMLGHRGCRLGISYPEVTGMQARAVFEAAAEAAKQKCPVAPELMIPLVGFARELELQTALIRNIANEVESTRGIRLRYRTGTMIEVPRSALIADELARLADFFSFGTNDLTQMTLGLSRDDMGSFLPVYTARNIFESNPFATLDESGVGQLVAHAVEMARRVQPNIKLGVCGEHGGDPHSIRFFERIGIDYVSCSPYRVPIARVAAAQAAVSVQSAGSTAKIASR